MQQARHDADELNRTEVRFAIEQAQQSSRAADEERRRTARTADEKSLRKAGFQVESFAAKPHEKSKRARHVIYVAR